VTEHLQQEQTLALHTQELPVRHSKVPAYLSDVYHWSYLHPRHVPWLDRESVVSLILWGQHNALRRAAFNEIAPGASVLQAAAVYGQFSVELARHLGPNGSLDLIDVAPIQVELTRRKLSAETNAHVHLADASRFDRGEYDVVLSYFLLHEVPDQYKTTILDNLLQRVKPGGKLVIVDYHKPAATHPLKPVMSLVFDWLEPFAKALWRHPIQYFCTQPDHYHWQQQTCFGGMYQKVVVTKK
jgi:ubiquinone/menaquinone biosynthesis C-methylase UbiE